MKLDDIRKLAQMRVAAAWTIALNRVPGVDPDRAECLRVARELLDTKTLDQLRAELFELQERNCKRGIYAR